jgi:hypothetical protein
VRFDRGTAVLAAGAPNYIRAVGLALPVVGQIVGELVWLVDLRAGVGGGLARNVVGLCMPPLRTALVGIRLAAVARAVIVARGHGGLLCFGRTIRPCVRT